MKWPLVTRRTHEREVATAFGRGWSRALELGVDEEYCTACGGQHDDNMPHMRIAPGEDSELDEIRGLLP